jgi:hypothetical protein
MVWVQVKVAADDVDQGLDTAMDAMHELGRTDCFGDELLNSLRADCERTSDGDKELSDTDWAHIVSIALSQGDAAEGSLGFDEVRGVEAIVSDVVDEDREAMDHIGVDCVSLPRSLKDRLQAPEGPAVISAAGELALLANQCGD